MENQQVVLITGTSTGIGYLATQKLAGLGFKVYASMRGIDGKNAKFARELSEFSENISVVELDVTSQDDVDSVVSFILDKEGKIDVLVNNAGVMNIGLTEAFTVAQLQAQMDVNYFGVARLFRAVLPAMRARKQGLVVTISSLAGRLIFPAFHSYNSSKFAVEALAEGYRYELSQYGVDSAIIEPGPFRTELVGNSPTPKDETVLASYGEFADMPKAVINGFDAFMDEHKNGDCNPQIVVDDLVSLIATPFGRRPLRTVSGLDYGTRDLNKMTEEFQAGVLAAMELEHLNPNR